MANLPRGASGISGGGGTLRPPQALTDTISGLPTLGRRTHTGGPPRRATLTSTTFAPFSDNSTNTPLIRSSGLSPPSSRMHSGTASPITLSRLPGDTKKLNGAGTIPRLGGSGEHYPPPGIMASGQQQQIHNARSPSPSPAPTALSRGHALLKTMEASPRITAQRNSAQHRQYQQGIAIRAKPVNGGGVQQRKEGQQGLDTMKVNDPVYIPTLGVCGTLRYLGSIDGKQGIWAGVELDEVGKGKNDGSVAGKPYFQCPPQTGIFLVPSKLEAKANPTTKSVPSADSVLSADKESSADIATPIQKRPNIGGRADRLAAMSTNLRRANIIHGGNGQSAKKPSSKTGNSVEASQKRRPRVLTTSQSTTASTRTLRARPASTASNRTISPAPRRHSTLRAPSYSESSNAQISRRPSTTGDDEAERMRLRIDMLEAENRVLKLKNEQGKAHIAAGQMLARDLAGPNGSVGSGNQQSTLSRRSVGWEMHEERELWQRERESNQLRIAELERQLKEVDSHSQKDQSSLVEEELRTRISELENAEHVGIEAKRELSEISQKHNDGVKEIEALRGSLESKDTEIGALNARVDRITTDLNHKVQQYQDLLQEMENKERASSEEEESIAKLCRQNDEIRTKLAKCEEKLSDVQKNADDESKQAAIIIENLKKEIAITEDRSAAMANKMYTWLVITLSQAIDDDDINDSASEYDSKEELVVEADEAGIEKLQEKVQSSITAKLDSLKQEIEAKNAELQKKLSEHDTSDQTNSAKSKAIQNLKARISELESMNTELVDERTSFIAEQKDVYEYMGKLESECNRLVEDIGQLTAENTRLNEDLRAASLHNSVVSLDIAAVDQKLSQSDQSNDESNNNAQASSLHDWSANLESLRASHQSEIATLKSQLLELEKRKDSEIKKLHDEVASLEDLVEDKIFSESELNDQINKLNNEIDRLKREIQRLRNSGANNTDSGSSKVTDSNADDKEDAEESVDSGQVDEDLVGGEGDDEYCEICDESGHSIVDCPMVTGSSHVFKQETPIDSSRPYCDNCESFSGHWTDECPHGDETF